MVEKKLTFKNKHRGDTIEISVMGENAISVNALSTAITNLVLSNSSWKQSE